jgi:ribosomal protein L9
VRKAGGPLLDKRSVEVSHVKEIGSHKARVRVSPEVTASVSFTVAAD